MSHLRLPFTRLRGFDSPCLHRAYLSVRSPPTVIMTLSLLGLSNSIGYAEETNLVEMRELY